MLGFQDEVWFSRYTHSSAATWTPGKPMRLVQNEAYKTDKQPKALACCELLRTDTGQMRLRFVNGRPVSDVTERFLSWLLARLAREGKRALLMVWDNARWHLSKQVRAWVAAHNRTVKKQGGCRLLVCPLPSKSPWFNTIEPKWAHGKRAVLQPTRKLSADELKTRLCDHYQCELLEAIPQ